jgi:CoA:oxalate CoA-transferase
MRDLFKHSPHGGTVSQSDATKTILFHGEGLAMATPLEGVRVLSFCRALSGPYASMLLSDLGAEVIKIEAPEMGDFARFSGPFIENVSSYFLSINRGKKSITLDLKNKRAREIVYRLVEHADILMENFRPGVMTRLGFGYDEVRRRNPLIIYASISGFGQNGPYAQRPAFDMVAQGMGGVMSITGEPGKAPVRVGYSIGDIGASLFGALAIVAALHERQRSAQGQHIDISMLDAQIALCENACARYFATGKVPEAHGSRHPLLTPFQAFPTQDGHIILIIMKGDEWEKFCRLAGKEEWVNDDKFGTLEARLAHYQEFEKAMNEVMKGRATSEWMEAFEAAGIMCAPINDIAQAVNDPQVQARDMILEVESRHGKLKVVGTPMKFSRTPCKIEKASPELGEHNPSVFSDLLNMKPEEIAELLALKVI